MDKIKSNDVDGTKIGMFRQIVWILINFWGKQYWVPQVFAKEYKTGLAYNILKRH